MADLATSPAESTCFTQASKDLKWCHAMDTEINVLLKNKTWSLVPYHPTLNLVGYKWIFKIKHKPDRSVDRYKARLVAKGFHQQPRLDYGETFSPVIKPTIVRTVCSLAVSKCWSIRQLDVNNTFLQDFLTETVYVEQPLGFIDLAHPIMYANFTAVFMASNRLRRPNFLASLVI